MKILFLTPYPKGTAPSQRFRFELYYPYLNKKGIIIANRSFFTNKAWSRLYTKGKILLKILDVFIGFVRRIRHTVEALRYDIIFIHRELTPIGPPVFEWWIAHLWRKKIIYDYDDAIWMQDGHTPPALVAALKWRSKVGKICRWSWKVSAGNEFLAEYARANGAVALVNPTVVDTTLHTPGKDIASETLVVGWTGSHSTLFYLESILPVLQNLQRKYDFNCCIIANRDPKLPLRNYTYVPWQERTEVEDLRQIHIGLMPLQNTEWERGKCGFKLIQYGSVGIPSIASPVGVNDEVVLEGVSGYLALTYEDWFAALEKLLTNDALRKKMGQAARQHIIDNYSVAANTHIWDQLLHETVK